MPTVRITDYIDSAKTGRRVKVCKIEIEANNQNESAVHTMNLFHQGLVAGMKKAGIKEKDILMQTREVRAVHSESKLRKRRLDKKPLITLVKTATVFMLFCLLPSIANAEIFTDCTCDCPVENPGPLCSRESFSGGTLWKPKGENSGSLVVLIRSDFPDFDACEVMLRDGVSFEEMSFTGRSNGDRQTWRASKPGGKTYAGLRKDGGVRCFLGDSCFSFQLPGKPRDRHE